MSGLNESLKWELKKVPFFQHLDADAFEALLESAKPAVFKPRAALFREGDPGGSMFLILSGQVKISNISVSGKECILAFAGAGDVIGEMTLFDGAARTATAETVEQTRTLEIGRPAFLQALEASPETAIRIIEILSRRLRATSQMAEDSTLVAAGPRLARALLRLVDAHGRNDGDSVVIDLKLSQGMLGAHAGLLRESVNRQMRAWEKDGLVSSDDGRIAILDPARLREIADVGLYS
jgi:CRP-like cAMP-binding protein